MGKWSEDTTMKFVTEYVSHECLWNVKSNLYKNKQARLSAYNKIKLAMHIPDFGVNEVISKIKNIRSTYSQELKKINDSKKSGVDEDSIYRPNVKWFKILDGVLSELSVEQRRAKSSNMNPDDSTGNAQSENNSAISESYAEDCGANSDEAEAFEQPRTSRKRTIKSINSMLHKVRRVTNEYDVPIVNDTANEFEIFGKGVGVQLSNLSLETALRAQNEIQNFLTKLRLQELGVGPNSPHPIIMQICDQHKWDTS